MELTPDECRQLLAAIAKNEDSAVSSLMARGLAPDHSFNLADRGGATTMLEYASECGSARVAKLLVAAGAKTDKGQFKALILAIMAGYEDIARILLESGADPNVRMSADSDGETGLTALMCAAEDSRRINIFEELLKHGADPNKVSNKGSSALSLAVEHDNRPAWERLLKLGCRANGKALLAAVLEGDPELVQALIHAGADVNFVGGTNDCLRYQTPLEGAIDRRTTSMLQGRVLSEGDPNKPARYLKIIRCLIEAGADPNRVTYLQAPLYKAAKAGDLEVTKLLLAARAVPDKAMEVGSAKKGDEIESALHAVAREGHIEIAQELLAAGADSNKRDRHGHTPLDIAESAGHASLAKTLVDAGGTKGSPVKAPKSSDWELNF